MDNQIIGGLLEVARKHLCESRVLVVALNHRQISLTVLTRGEIHDISNSDIDNAQEPLILLLEFLLVEYLYRKYAFFRGAPRHPCQHCISLEGPSHSQVKALVPVWVQCSLDNGRRLGLLAAESRHSEGIGESCELLSVLILLVNDVGCVRNTSRL
jgi:hypothetical protein